MQAEPGEDIMHEMRVPAVVLFGRDMAVGDIAPAVAAHENFSADFFLSFKYRDSAVSVCGKTGSHKARSASADNRYPLQFTLVPASVLR